MEKSRAFLIRNTQRREERESIGGTVEKRRVIENRMRPTQKARSPVKTLVGFYIFLGQTCFELVFEFTERSIFLCGARRG